MSEPRLSLRYSPPRAPAAACIAVARLGPSERDALSATARELLKAQGPLRLPGGRVGN